MTKKRYLGCACKSMLSLKQLQAESSEWTTRNFGKHPSYQPLLGAVEEIGELAHAHLKSEQGIRGYDVLDLSHKIDAVADIIIYLADYCNQEGIDMQEALENTWEAVSKRDWKKNPNTGV